ncbi:hypothetical protein M2280_004057 [Prescottella agglutinans]|uniref:Uncharacterized protein n=1 Tax=Prescottella agglutinans TaxID=1644129 RepID=A0ABT6MF11_9NOCA|nr:hypothetical protein [Prescottella agglutinans]
MTDQPRPKQSETDQILSTLLRPCHVFLTPANEPPPQQ